MTSDILKENLATRGESFDPEVSLLENLQNILGVQFPSPSSTGDGEAAGGAGDCGICYNYHLVSIQLHKQ